MDGFPSASYIELGIYFKEMVSEESKLDLEDKFDKGNFKTLEDKLLSAASNSNNFDDFLLLFGERSVARLSNADEKQLREKYKKAKSMRQMNLNDDGGQMAGYSGDKILISEDCSILVESYLLENNHNYPNTEWVLASRLSYTCDCEKDSDQTMLNEAQYQYTAKINSLRTATDIVFDEAITEPKLEIKNVVCCPEQSDPEETENGDFIKDTRDLFLDPNKQNVPTDSDDANEEGGFFKEAGSFTYGVSLGSVVGEESDFYGINYGANVGYLFEFKDSKFSAGPEVEYSRFTGKETDFGFETEGESFLNIKARANYGITDWLDASAAAGYGIGVSEGVDGGISFDVGTEISPSSQKRQDVSSSTRIYYSLRFRSNSVEGGSFKSVNAGVGLKID